MSLLWRLATVAGLIALWFLTQRLLGSRGLPKDGIGDKIHDWLEPLHRRLTDDPKAARALLISSSLGIDVLTISVLYLGIFGPSFAPIAGLAGLFLLRQVSQYLTALSPPPGMIWRDPGVPSLFVTYGVGNDLFFSGHTALAVYGALTLGAVGGPVLALAAAAVAVFEIFAVLALRAHWTMDVYAGLVTAILCFLAAQGMTAVLEPGALVP